VNRDYVTDTLERIATTAVVADAFPALRLVMEEGQDVEVLHNRMNARAFMVLLSATEAGVPFVDALNRARFDEHGLTFAPDPNKLTLEQHIIGAQQYAVPADPGVVTVERIADRQDTATYPDDAGTRIPHNYMSPSKPMGEASIGELAVFYEEAYKKVAHPDERSAAWRVLAAKLPTQSALELGKLTRWILNKHHQPARREMFQDVLTVAEKRLEELGGAS
jgi:hypothetical protein